MNPAGFLPHRYFPLQLERYLMTSEVQAAARTLGWGAPTPTLFDVKHKHGHVTRDGCKARYLGSIDSALGERHVFAITQTPGQEVVQKVFANGNVNPPHLWDNAHHKNDMFHAAAPTVKRTTWVNVYPNHFDPNGLSVCWHPSQAAADKNALKSRVACFELSADVPVA